MRPVLFRPPFLLSFVVSALSGFDFVTSSNVETVMNRRPADVGLYLRIGISSPHPSEAMGVTRPAEDAQHFSRHTWAPVKISIVSPGFSWTIAFFHPGF